MKFKLQGERLVQDKYNETRRVEFICEAEVAGILLRMEHESIHIRGMEGGRCMACKSKDTYPWMDVATQKRSEEHTSELQSP